jgi:hypothetical protein
VGDRKHFRGLIAGGAVAVVLVLLPSSALSFAWLGKTQALRDASVNTTRIAPTAAQKQAVKALGAHAAWNRFGTPSSLLKPDGWLATGLSGSPVQVAKSFIDQHEELFKTSSSSLALVNDVTLRGTNAHAVLFAQKFGSFVADWNGLIAVGVRDGKVAYVSSSATSSPKVTGSVKLSPTEAWTAAAKAVGVEWSGSLSAPTTANGWTSFDAPGLTSALGASSRKLAKLDLPPLPALPALPGLPGGGTTGGTTGGGTTGGGTTANPAATLGALQAAIAGLLGGQSTSSASTPAFVGVHQGAKLVAFPTVKNGVRPAYLVNVVDLRSVQPRAFQVMVDAGSGAVLMRHDAVQQLAADSTTPAYTFTGEYAPPNCGPTHTFSVGAGMHSLAAAASAVNPANDIVLKVVDPSGNTAGTSDTATSPEAVAVMGKNGGELAPGMWGLQVCPFNGEGVAPGVPNQIAPYTYIAAAVVTAAGVTTPTLPRPLPPTLVTNTPRWAFFPSFPSTDYATTAQSEGCWENTSDGLAQPKPCEFVFKSPYSPFGWDVVPRDNQTTLTTRGNNAFTAEDWLSPLTPAEQRSPVSPSRYYDRNFPGGNFVWANSWNQSKCDPSVLADPTRNNGDIDASTTNLFVMHNRMHDFAYGLGFTEQTYNAQLDNLDHPGAENDPELGNAQAGAVTGGQPSFEGRDNANQITLNDGVPPITNQYLWQPIASAFYSPCTDGSFDLSVAGHEYTHLISNRMVGGPDASLTGLQSGAMGESWSDLDALEYLHEHDLAGKQGENPWSLGAYVTGNKDKGIRDYALNANPLNYSDVGFDTTGPEVHADGEIWNGVNYDLRQALVAKYGDATSEACATGATPADQCGGGRRWIQLVYDAWLLEQADVTFVDARDAMLAADLLRFGGANQKALWDAFAHRGLGIGASTANSDDDQPTPSFESPQSDNATVSFVTVAKDGPNAGATVPAKVFVGDYQARVTPIPQTTKLVPGTYSFVVQAPGYGLVKFSRTLDASAQTLTIALPTNWASAANDATTAGDGVNQAKLIDDDENTNWASLSGPVAGKQVTVSLAGRHVLSSARVSGLNHPSTCDGAEEQGVCALGSGNDPDNTAQNRFSALRAFTIQACDSSTKNCSLPQSWVTAYDSAADAFPASRPRPTAADENLRSFDLKDVPATMVRLVVKTNQCTGGPDFQGDQDSDPSNDSDCQSSANATKVRAAELEVVSSAPTITSAAGTKVVQAAAQASGGSTSATATAPAAVTVVGAPTSTASSPSVVASVAGTKVTLRRLAARGTLRGVTFSLSVLGRAGTLRLADRTRHVTVRSTRLTKVVVDYNRRLVTVGGLGRANGKLVRFTLRLTDRGAHDAIAVRLSNGYRLSGRLASGGISL